MELLVVFAPFLSAMICGGLNKLLSHKMASIISIFLMCISTIFALKILVAIHSGHHIIHHILGSWIEVAGVKINWAIYVDELTSVMFAVVTIVSTIVHIYSYGYMHDDANLPRFMSYLSFFTFFMLALVCADNFVQLFFGWEGVGLCSYLLIGFWYKKDSASSAAIKAFVVNRVGDFGFILGALAIIYYTGSADFGKVFSHATFLTTQTVDLLGFHVNALEMICLCLFFGCMGKSAQIGLHVWLPDAMEGPTPVSALIHAATMVTAGVFLVARCSSFFALAPLTSSIILWIGAITCLFAATTAIAQTDIKKIIAYSTCSQLGYMFMACGALEYSAGIFHLVTHAFFKAMLFLAAGIVIHAVHEQDIFKMGGLYKKLPVTYVLFWLGSLAIMGIYPFAGYYSKDLILESVFEAGAIGPFVIGLIAAFFTALYSMKIIILVFHGPPSKLAEHAHEGPWVMIAPLFILALGSIFAGSQLLQYFHHGVQMEKTNIQEMMHYSPLVMGIAGLVCGILMYKFGLAKILARMFGMVHGLFKNKYFFDELYEKIFGCSVRVCAQLSKIFDGKIIDDLGPGTGAEVVSVSARFVSYLQSGYIFTYAFFMLIGVIGVMSFWLVTMLRN